MEQLALLVRKHAISALEVVIVDMLNAHIGNSATMEINMLKNVTLLWPRGRFLWMCKYVQFAICYEHRLFYTGMELAKAAVSALSPQISPLDP